jgi:hypothetical protein
MKIYCLSHEATYTVYVLCLYVDNSHYYVFLVIFVLKLESRQVRTV